MMSLIDLFDDTPRISRRRAEALWQRQEMDRHPVDRVEPWAGMGPYVPIGEPIRPGEIRKAPVFAELR